MKLLFVNSAYPQEIDNRLRKHSKVGLQSAANVFQWAVIDGLERCGIDYTLACTPGLPAWPRFDDLFTPEGPMSVNGKQRGHYLRYCSLPVLNQITKKTVLKRYIRNWCERNKKQERLVVLTYTQESEQLGPAVELKQIYPNLVVAPIVTDLIENALEFKANRKLLKRIQVYLEEKKERGLFPKVDKFILLSNYMTECIPEAEGRYMVMEGVASWKSISKKERASKSDEPRTLLYTGTFQEFGGLRMLVDAFRQTTGNNFRLVLCGNGVLRPYVEEAAVSDNRIIYKGLVSHDEVIRLQRECTLLINPRRPNGGITKYSFPSKTMEYMASMTPMIGYHLEGIPEEYYQHMYTPNDLSQDSLTSCINTTLALPLEMLHHKAEAAFDFVAKHKNSEAQVSRIIDFLNS